MPGHKAFKKLWDMMPPERRARVEQTLSEMRDERRKRDSLPDDGQNAPSRTANVLSDEQESRD